MCIEHRSDIYGRAGLDSAIAIAVLLGRRANKRLIYQSFFETIIWAKHISRANRCCIQVHITPNHKLKPHYQD